MKKRSSHQQISQDRILIKLTCMLRNMLIAAGMPAALTRCTFLA
jgi:hypothetical protein